MRVVLDTSVLVAAIRSDAGASRLLLVNALRRKFTLLVSVSLMIEYQAVMTRSDHLEASGLVDEDVGKLLDAVAAIAHPVRLAFLWRPTLPDPNDDMVLEAAVNGSADAIVTFNKKDFARQAPRFGIDVLSPGEACKHMEITR